MNPSPHSDSQASLPSTDVPPGYVPPSQEQWSLAVQYGAPQAPSSVAQFNWLALVGLLLSLSPAAAWGLSSFLVPPTPDNYSAATSIDYNNQYALVAAIVGLISLSGSISALVTSAIALRDSGLQGRNGMAVAARVVCFGRSPMPPWRAATSKS